jgi:DNA primase
MNRRAFTLFSFDRDALPVSTSYYPEHGVKLRGTGAWRDAICPFHDDHKASLRVRVETGAFRCMACGAHGGDVLAFARLRYGWTFVEAAKRLGAWRGIQA